MGWSTTIQINIEEIVEKWNTSGEKEDAIEITETFGDSHGVL